MSAARRHAVRLLPWLFLAAGVTLLWIALRHFDRLGLLDVYHLPEYRRIPVQRRSGFYLPCIAGLASLVTAAVLFLRARNQPESAGSLLNPGNSRP
ncbi:MAG TPA: hypothetical protein VN519_02890 [Bryobacteraceae bacterium]|nr:hypothetical protein [Bryobacteraceae bacterium]